MSFFSILINRNKGKARYKKKELKYAISELIVYIIFLINASIISLTMTGSSTFFLINSLRKVFLESGETTFNNIATIDDYWEYVRHVTPDIIFKNETETENKNNSFYFLRDNLFLGRIRLRQLKVKASACPAEEVFKPNNNECYGDFSESHIDTAPFGNGWEYHYINETKSFFTWGQLEYYPGSGHFIDLKIEKTEYLQEIENLFSNQWITNGTRVMFYEFNIFNPNVNVFCTGKLIAEMPATGGIITSYKFKPVKLVRFVSIFDYVVFGCEILFLVLVLWFTIVELFEFFKTPCSYFKSFWNIIDFLIIVLSVFVLLFSLYRYTEVDDILKGYLEHPEKYINLDFVTFWQIQYNDGMAIVVFLIWLKIFRFVAFSKTLYQFYVILGKCAKDLVGFAIILVIVLIAYAQLGFLLFGSSNEHFRSFKDATITLLRIILGDFDYPAIEQSNRILGPIYFLTYVFFVFLILMNMFLAIINDTYTEVKEKPVKSEIDLESCLMGKRCCSCCRSRKKQDKRLTFDSTDSSIYVLLNDLFKDKGRRKSNVPSVLNVPKVKLQDLFENIELNPKTQNINENLKQLSASIKELNLKFMELLKTLKTK